MGRFDDILIVDWSAGNRKGPKPSKDAIWMATATTPPTYHRDRADAEATIVNWIDTALSSGKRVALGFDFGFGYPAGVTETITGRDDPFALWNWFEERVEDRPSQNNRFAIGAEMNEAFPGLGPFWGCLGTDTFAALPARGNDRTYRHTPARRIVEEQATGSFECWQLAYAGAVGSQIIMGLPMLARLRRRFSNRLAVWPFEAATAEVTLIEVWPSLLAQQVKAAEQPDDIRDAVQVSLLAQALAKATDAQMRTWLDAPCTSEGWILGVGHEADLRRAANGARALWRGHP